MIFFFCYLLLVYAEPLLQWMNNLCYQKVTWNFESIFPSFLTNRCVNLPHCLCVNDPSFLFSGYVEQHKNSNHRNSFPNPLKRKKKFLDHPHISIWFTSSSFSFFFSNKNKLCLKMFYCFVMSKVHQPPLTWPRINRVGGQLRND